MAVRELRSHMLHGKVKKTFFFCLFLQRRHTAGQQEHEKISASLLEKCNEILPHTGQNGHHQSLQINAGEGVEKRELSYTVGENVNWCSHYGEHHGRSLKN